MFGWIKKKKVVDESVKAVASEVKQVSIPQVDKIVSDIKSESLKVLLQHANSVRDSVIERRDSILRIISRLEQDNLKMDQVDIHLKLQIERRKNVVVTGVKKETSIELIKAENYQDALNLNSNLSKMLNRMGDILGTNARFMHNYAKKYSSRLKVNLEAMTSEGDRLKRLVEKHGNLESDISDVIEGCQSISESKKKIEDKNKMIIEVEREINSYGKKIKQLKQDIENLKSQKEYQEFTNTKKDIDSLSSEENYIKNQIDLQFSKISRPLGKYSYISSLEKPLKKLMVELVENPSKILTLENKNSIIQILESVTRAVLSGSVSVKDSQKSVQSVKETIDRLDEFMSLKTKLLQKKVSLEKKLLVFDLEMLINKEKDLKKAIEDNIRVESKIKPLKEEINDAEKRIPHLIMDTEIKLKEISGTPVHLQV